jgi:hypothetical protein
MPKGLDAMPSSSEVFVDLLEGISVVPLHKPPVSVKPSLYFKLIFDFKVCEHLPARLAKCHLWWKGQWIDTTQM